MGDREAEVEAHLARAADSLRAGQVLLENAHWDIAASRAYYAAFHAASAALLRRGLAFGRHSGVIASVHQHLVKTGVLDGGLGRDLNWLFELRGIGDYGDTRHVPQDEATRALAASRRLVAALSALAGPRTD
jgi:uncharacterized protein (UPF0332 family)